MPTYEYRCNACQREFEYQQKMSDPDLVTCEACGEDKLERLISWTAVRGNSWQQGLYSNNPKQALQGTTAIERSKAQRFKAEPAVPAPAPAAETDKIAADDEDDEDSDEDKAP